MAVLGWGKTSGPDRLRVFDANDLGTPGIEDAQWTPAGATTLDVLDFDLAGTFVAWIGWGDDDRTVAPRVGVADLADGLGSNPVDLGEALGTFSEIVGSDRLILWHDDRDLHAIAAPFESETPVVIDRPSRGGPEGADRSFATGAPTSPSSSR